MSNIYTYVVNHGGHPPKVKLKNKINGGDLIAVSARDEIKKSEDILKFLSRVADTTEDSSTQFMIEDYLNNDN